MKKNGYMVLGMKKGRISRLFAGETLCVGVIALVSGLVLGFLFSQGLSLVALKLFAIELDKFQIVFSAGAFRQTVLCFAIIFFIVMLFNVWSVTNVKLIDLLTASRKNESIKAENRVLPICLFVLSLICIGISAVLFNKNGILPSRDNMAIINLRDYYPFYTSDCFMEVSEEVAEMFKEFDRKEAAYRLRTYRHKAYYSLDRDDGLEHEAVFVALSPHELYERKVTMQELHAAIANLPDKQAKRIYAHFILGMTKQDIARAEGVHEKVVRVAIERGLRHLEKILKNSL